MESTLTRPKEVHPAIAVSAIVIALAVLWETCKLVFAISDSTLPHLWSIASAFVEPARRDGPPLFTILFDAALFTAGNAVLGFLIGALLGFVLGAIFAHSPLLERGLVPYLVASQTVPILAIAPMIVIWLNRTRSQSR